MLNIKKDDESKTPETAQTDEVRFSSHPITNYSIGDYQFKNGLLVLDAEEAEKFQELLDSLPASESHRVKVLDVSAAEAQVRAILENQPKATKQTDSSVGDRAPNKEVGTGKLEDSGKEETK